MFSTAAFQRHPKTPSGRRHMEQEASADLPGTPMHTFYTSVRLWPSTLHDIHKLPSQSWHPHPYTHPHCNSKNTQLQGLGDWGHAMMVRVDGITHLLLLCMPGQSMPMMGVICMHHDPCCVCCVYVCAVYAMHSASGVAITAVCPIYNMSGISSSPCGPSTSHPDAWA